MEGDWFLKLYRRSGEPLGKISTDDFLSLLRTKCTQIVTEEELKKLLTSGKKLRVKLGIDATGAEIHLGHAVPLMLLRLFQRRGDEVQLLIGDFTGKIGDPSGRTEKRREITDAEIAANIKTYKKQVAPIMDLKKAKVYRNSKWLSKMPLGKFFEMIGSVSFGEVAQREDFRERMKAGSPVSLREANYASLMGIDSVMLKTDIEVGAVDQLLNFMQTRSIMAGQGMPPEIVLVTPLIEGTAGDGRKMSKSFHNYIALADSADNQFGLIMSIPDRLLASYFRSFGDIYEREQKALDDFIGAQPLEAKKQLAALVAALFHGEKAAHKARENFERKFSKGRWHEADAKEVRLSADTPLLDALFAALGGKRSRTHIRNLIEAGAVRRISGLAEHIYGDASERVRRDDLIRVGKRDLFRFIIQ